MPCQHNCEVKRLNLILKDIKHDKIKTLKNIYEVTEELGRENPHRREEVARSKREISQKLMAGIAELMYIKEELSRGCTTCRVN